MKGRKRLARCIIVVIGLFFAVSSFAAWNQTSVSVNVVFKVIRAAYSDTRNPEVKLPSAQEKADKSWFWNVGANADFVVSVEALSTGFGELDSKYVVQAAGIDLTPGLSESVNLAFEPGQHAVPFSVRWSGNEEDGKVLTASSDSVSLPVVYTVSAL
ncbi:MAG TPA: hypothetical protein P5560_05105 [Thermotogota bacterium]|nr:hypothetical protein [Thermotogota bacterium]HRW92315.1 hypothetical protein [Thermotogota bacterium]